MKTNISQLAVLLAFSAAEGSVVVDAQTGAVTGKLVLTTPPEGELAGATLEVTTEQFDIIYRNMVRVWPVVKPLKEQVMLKQREATTTAKAKAKEDAKAAKIAEKAKAKADRDAKVAADKAAKEQAKADAKAAKDKAAADAKAAKDKAAADAKAAKDKAAADKAAADKAAADKAAKDEAAADKAAAKNIPAAPKGKGKK